MSKEKKESDILKTPKEASNIFHNIMKASVSGNPKPKEKNKSFGIEYSNNGTNPAIIIRFNSMELALEYLQTKYDSMNPETRKLQGDILTQNTMGKIYTWTIINENE